MRMLTLLFVLTFALAAPARADPVSDRIYPAPRAPLTAEGLPAGVEMVEVATADGLVLKGLAAPAREGLPTLLLFHGNGSSAADAVRWFAPALQRGYGLVAAEYRGYSGNPGRPSEAGLAADADAFMALTRRRAEGGALWVVGHSLGGGVALALAERSPPDVVVTIGAFTRLRDMVSGLLRAVVPDAYRNLAIIPRLTRPWFLIHGLADDVVPAAQGQALHVRAGRSNLAGASFVIQGADHRPPGATLADILDVIRARPEPGAPSASDLPPSVGLILFGDAR